MMAGRPEMDLDDWARGGELVALSTAMLAHLDVAHASEANLQRVGQLQTRANAEAYIEDAKADHNVRRVERWVLSHIPSGGVKQTVLRKTIAGRDKSIFNEALDNLVREGKVLRGDDGMLRLP